MAKIYTDKIFHHIEILAQTPYVGHARPDIPSAYFALNAEKHVIVYTQRQGTIYLARILHSRMDFTGQDIY